MFCLKIYHEDWTTFNDYTRTVIHQWLNNSRSDAVAVRLKAQAQMAGTA